MEVAKPDVVNSLQQSLQTSCLKQQNSFRIRYRDVFIGDMQVQFFFRYVYVSCWRGRSKASNMMKTRFFSMLQSHYGLMEATAGTMVITASVLRETSVFKEVG